MIRVSQNQKGSAHVVVIVVLVIALLGALGFVFWNNFLNNKKTTTNDTTVDTSQEPVDKKAYKNETLGISFSYPKEWVKIVCNNDQTTVYFGSDDRGIGMNNGSSILCGEGTDFPPQMSFSIKKDFSYEGDTQSADVMIDGKNAKKYTHTTGNESILPGLETTTYVVKTDSKNSVVMVYHKWLDNQSGSYDTSDETKQEFTKLVEESLRFL